MPSQSHDPKYGSFVGLIQYVLHYTLGSTVPYLVLYRGFLPDNTIDIVSYTYILTSYSFDGLNSSAGFGLMIPLGSGMCS